MCNLTLYLLTIRLNKWQRCILEMTMDIIATAMTALLTQQHQEVVVVVMGVVATAVAQEDMVAMVVTILEGGVEGLVEVMDREAACMEPVMAVVEG